MKVKLLIIIPACPPNGDEGPHAEVLRSECLTSTMDVDKVYCSGAPEEVWNEIGAQKVAPLVVEKAKWAEANGYHAAVVACMLDPGVALAKRTVSIPIVGAREACRATATLVGNRPAVVYPSEIRVPDLLQNVERTYGRLKEISEREISGGSDVILLGCARLNDLASRLQTDLRVPVLPSVEVALKHAEMLVCLALRSSQPQPLRARITWFRRTFSKRVSRAVAALAR